MCIFHGRSSAFSGLDLVRSKPPARAPPSDLWLDSPYSQVPDSDDYLFYKQGGHHQERKPK